MPHTTSMNGFSSMINSLTDGVGRYKLTGNCLLFNFTQSVCGRRLMITNCNCLAGCRSLAWSDNKPCPCSIYNITQECETWHYSLDISVMCLNLKYLQECHTFVFVVRCEMLILYFLKVHCPHRFAQLSILNWSAKYWLGWKRNCQAETYF